MTRSRWWTAGLTVLVVAALASSGLVFLGGWRARHPVASAASAVGARTLDVPAPGFTLTDQFGQRVSLSQFRGKAVVLAFIDSQCTTICPVTNSVMTAAVRDLGAAGKNVQLLGVNANPKASSQADVRAYSSAHDMLYAWRFLTGMPTELTKVWRAYNVYNAVTTSGIDHDPAVFIIDPEGREHTELLSQMSFTSVGVQASTMAAALADALAPDGSIIPNPGAPGASAVAPGDSATLPGLKPGAPGVIFGPGHPHVVVFVASWLAQSDDVTARLAGLNAYQRAASSSDLPSLVVVDLQTTEPTRRHC